MTQRKRATGFALMDTAFAADAKFVRLARRAPSEIAFATAVGVYWLVLADARRARNATVNWDDYTEYADQIALLKEAKLLTKDGFDATTFDRWAPAYKSPWDKERAGTQGDAEVLESTHATPTSALLSSTHITSPQERTDGGVGEGLPDADDAVTAACRMFLNGGEWLGNKDYVARWADMVRRYSDPWVKAEIQPAYAELLARGSTPRPWDLRRMVEWRCAERARAEELADEKARQSADRDAAELSQRRLREITPEERERADTMSRAIGLWIKKQPGVPMPTEYDELAAWLEQNGAAA